MIEVKTYLAEDVNDIIKAVLHGVDRHHTALISHPVHIDYLKDIVWGDLSRLYIFVLASMLAQYDGDRRLIYKVDNDELMLPFNFPNRFLLEMKLND